MKKLVFFLTICLALLLNSCAKPIEDYSTSIYGTVIDADTYEPLQGVLLTLIPSTKNCYTGSNGYYEFADLEAQKYTITAQLSGYQADRKSFNLYPKDRLEITFSLKKVNYEEN